MKRFSRLGFVSLLVVVASAVVGGLLGGRVLAGGSSLNDELRLYTQALDTVQREYVDEVPADQLVSSSIRQMLRTLDPHSNFLEPTEHDRLQERQRGSYYGLGITVQSVDGNITVVSPFEGTPAHRLGIRAGDIISRIDGEDARGMSIEDAVKRLRGPKGTSVAVTIVRRGYDEPLEFTVIRDEIPLHSVPYYFMIARDTGYVRLIDFNETTACRPGEGEPCQGELETAIEKLRGQGATAILLDIRDNPGGLLDQAFAVSNLFLHKGQLVVYTRGRTKRDESNYITDGDSRFANLPLVLLTSQHSASASEIVAGAIQDHDRGLIVGQRTFGKGLVQTILPLRTARGYALALTTARYYTPSGRSIQRDYGSTALEDYVVLPDDRGCEEENTGEPKFTDAGRKVYGGDGIAPDYCVDPAQPTKLVSQLESRHAFFDFSMLYDSADNEKAGAVGAAGTRSEQRSEKVKRLHVDFQVDDAMWKDFAAFLDREKIEVDGEELAKERETVTHRIYEEILRQVFGEGEARERTLQWDPQIQKALQVVPKARLLLEDPEQFIAERQAKARVASR
jgi:carboxyl-terminal processing protease